MLTSFNQVHLISNTWLCHCRLSPPVVAPAFSRYLSRSPSTFCYSIPFPRLSKCDHEWSLTNFFHQWAWSLETLGRPVCRPSTIKLSIWTLALPLYTAKLLTCSCGSVVQVFCVQVRFLWITHSPLKPCSVLFTTPLENPPGAHQFTLSCFLEGKSSGLWKPSPVTVILHIDRNVGRTLAE